MWVGCGGGGEEVKLASLSCRGPDSNRTGTKGREALRLHLIMNHLDPG